MPSRDILLKTNRPGSFGLAGAALRSAECRDIQPFFGPAFFSYQCSHDSKTTLAVFCCIIRTYTTRGELTRDVQLSVSTDWQRLLPPAVFSLTYKTHESMK